MSSREVHVIELRFDGFGRAGHQAGAAVTYRAAGLMEHPVIEMHSTEAMLLPVSSTDRGSATGLLNEAALFAAIDSSASAVSSSLSVGGFPIVVGGDCSVLVGIFGGAHATDESFGLLFIDGHEDTTPLDVVEDGEAANTELGLLLGLTGRMPTYPRPQLTGTLTPERLASVGMRDHDFRRQANIGSVADLGAFYRSAEDARKSPSRAGQDAAAHLAGGPWWMHVDLDVLAPTELPATLVPGETEQEPGGLTWNELTALMTTAAATGECRGLSVAIYDPEQDPAGMYPPRIVALIHDVLSATLASR